MESRDAKLSQDVIIKHVKEYLVAIYRTSIEFKRKLAIGVFRAYVHGLGDGGAIPRTTEFTVCAQDFDELTFRRANVTIVFLLKEGFHMKNGGVAFVNDDLIEWAMRGGK
ncbi:MAG: hypothetical protein E7029_10015 [Planctomycetaceae bacterium]|nr:hypothetical protein [Planctomycetaceae bacterium]